MKASIAGTLFICALGSVALSVSAQEMQRGVAVVSEDVSSQIPAFSYREGPESKLLFQGTALVPRSEGRGEVEFQNGRARIAVGIHRLPEPWKLGPYTVYVLWALTLEGRAANLGTLEGEGTFRELDTSAPLSSFALMVTAEPHFAVTAPSKAVVARNLADRVVGKQSMVRTVQERADYANLSAQNIDPNGKTPLALYQARYAIAIAKAVDADKFASQAFGRASKLLSDAEAAQVDKKSSVRRTVPTLAREAVQAAEDARRESWVSKVAAAEKVEREKVARAAAEAAAAKANEEGAQRAALAAKAAAARAREEARLHLEARIDTVLPTRVSERGLIAEIAGVQFSAGASQLGPSAREALARFAGIVASYPSLAFMVEGHTDATGNPAKNESLSLARAISVRDYLISQGVAASKIDVAGLGPNMPVADNETLEGRARNRRVEIVMWGEEIGI